MAILSVYRLRKGLFARRRSGLRQNNGSARIGGDSLERRQAAAAIGEYGADQYSISDSRGWFG